LDSQTYRPAPMSVSLALSSGVLAFLGIIGLAALPLLIVRHEPGLIIMVPVLWVLIIYSWFLRPRCYEITDESIIITRQWPYKNAIIPLAGIKEVKRGKVGKARMNYGTDWFSLTGWFRNKEFGKFFMSVTDPDKVVLLSNGVYCAISPRYPDEFVADLKRIINQV
jgi:hypothetical protein